MKKNRYLRVDQRSPRQLRPIQVKRHYLKYAEGSCLITCGNTKVVCSVSMDDKVPSFLKDRGTGWITAEYGMLPRSCSERIQRNRPSGRTYEIQRLIGRSLRAVTDLSRLGARTLLVDCDVLQGDGGTRCASITGGFIALADALDHLRKKGLLKGKLPLKDVVTAVSVGMVKGNILLDLTYEEDSQAEVDMNVVMTGKGQLVEIQGTAEKDPFSQTDLLRMLDAARKGISELTGLQRQLLKALL
ncbi:MAG: ribonuclease PH [Candidatus Omnitrophota bacterium]